MKLKFSKQEETEGCSLLKMMPELALLHKRLKGVTPRWDLAGLKDRFCEACPYEVGKVDCLIRMMVDRELMPYLQTCFVKAIV